MAEKVSKEVSSQSFDKDGKDSKAQASSGAQLVIDKEEYLLKKRLPKKLPKRKNDVYVNRKTDFKAQLKRCQKLLDTEFNEVYIHGLGAATNRAINLALHLKANGLGSVDVAVHTSTVDIIDDLEPLSDELEPQTQTRATSAVHIKVFRPHTPVDV